LGVTPVVGHLQVHPEFSRRLEGAGVRRKNQYSLLFVHSIFTSTGFVLFQFVNSHRSAAVPSLSKTSYVVPPRQFAIELGFPNPPIHIFHLVGKNDAAELARAIALYPARVILPRGRGFGRDDFLARSSKSLSV